MTGSKAIGPFLGSAPTVRTGKVSARSGFKTKEGRETFDLLDELLRGLEDSPEYRAITEFGLSLINKDTTRDNLALARNLMADRSTQISKGLSRSLLNRGVVGSGFSSSQLLSANAQERSDLINNALMRAFSEKLQAGQLGAGLLSSNIGQKQNFAQILANYVSGLLGSGIAGQTQTYAVRQGSRDTQASNQFDLLNTMINNKEKF